MGLLPGDFESPASTSFTTPAMTRDYISEAVIVKENITGNQQHNRRYRGPNPTDTPRHRVWEGGIPAIYSGHVHSSLRYPNR